MSALRLRIRSCKKPPSAVQWTLNPMLFHVGSICPDQPPPDPHLHPACSSEGLDIPFSLARCCRFSCVHLAVQVGRLPPWLDLGPTLQAALSPALFPGWTLNSHDRQQCPWLSPAGTPASTFRMDRGPSSVPTSGTVGGLWPYHHPGPNWVRVCPVAGGAGGFCLPVLGFL